MNLQRCDDHQEGGQRRYRNEQRERRTRHLARAELVRLVAARIRLQAARTRVLSAEELAQASARMAESTFMDFTIREIE